MKLVTHECPNCGAHLDISEGKVRGKCEYCRVSYTINSGGLKVLHPLKVTDETQLRVAEASLYKFKDYNQSEILFKKLLCKHADIPNVYIGLILSVTHDFKINTGSLFDIASINEYWKRFIVLADEHDILKYESDYKKYCANFWLTKLNSCTDSFSDYTIEESNSTLDSYYDNYSINVDKNQAHKIKTKLDTYKTKRNQHLKKRRVIRFIVIVSIIILGILIYIFINNYFKNDEPKIKDDVIYVSEILNNDYCDRSYSCTDYSFLLNHFENSFSHLRVSSAIIDRNSSKIEFYVVLTNFKGEKTFKYEFSIKDDIGPYIVDKNCSFTDTDSVNLNKCFEIDSFDKNIKVNKDSVKIITDGINFKEVGDKSVFVSFEYEGKTYQSYINIYISKSDFDFMASLNSYDIEINKKTNINFYFSKEIPNKKLIYDYDPTYISLNADNNSIVGIKPGFTDVCISPEYDETKISCFQVNILPTCKGTYTFKYDGVGRKKLHVGTDFCPGIYKIYANVLNDDNYYYIDLDNEKGVYEDLIIINKKYPSVNEEGKKFSFPMNYSLEIPSGVTQIKLIKQ